MSGVVYDLIHSNYWYSGIVGLALRDAWSIPQVHMNCSFGQVRQAVLGAEGEDAFYGVRHAEERRVAHNAEATVVSSPFEKELVMELFGLSPNKIYTIPIGVDSEVILPRGRAMARLRLGLPQEAVVVLHVGRAEWRKGLNTLAAAWPMVSAQTGGALLVVVGTDSSIATSGDARLEDFRTLVRTSLYASEIVLAGQVDHADLSWYYSASDVCVVPSYYETFGLVAIEAMACGTPVVASQVGGLQYTVVDGVTGRLIKPQDATALRDGILDTLGPTNVTLARKARERVLAHFTWGNLTSKYLHMYDELTGVGGRERASPDQWPN